jgi:hypothetical protein
MVYDIETPPELRRFKSVVQRFDMLAPKKLSKSPFDFALKISRYCRDMKSSRMVAYGSGPASRTRRLALGARGCPAKNFNGKEHTQP